MSDYEIKNLREVEDMAVKHGFSETQEARFPREELGAETTGLAYHVVRPGKRQAFAHRHDRGGGSQRRALGQRPGEAR